ncbi:hypothetical protein MBLNU457_2272t1 [Dothideomycetes sp. NU457]
MEDPSMDNAVQDEGMNTATDSATSAPEAVDDTSASSQDVNNKTSAQPPTESADTSVAIQHWVDRALNFFSHASNETLGACFVGLGASTYIILGRVGLVLIGVVGGIALHATWESQASHGDKDAATDKERRRRELGLDVVNRVWKWQDNRHGAQDDNAQSKSEDASADVMLYSGKKLDFGAFEPDTAAALDTFCSAVIRDYVDYWYAPIVPGEESFPFACRQTLVAFILSLSTHLSRKRPVDIFLDFVTNSSSIVIVFLNELAAALNALPNAEATVAIETYLKMKPESSLARILDSEQQTKKLDMVAEDILQNYLESKAYNCSPVHAFLKQILSKLVLAMTLDMCSKPEWINDWIVYLLQDGEPEIMQAIDAGVEDSNGSRPAEAVKSGKQASDTLETVGETPQRSTVSRDEAKADDAMLEIQRLNRMIAEEEALRAKERQAAGSSSEDISERTTQGILTPGSSQSEGEKLENVNADVVDQTQLPAQNSYPSETAPATPPAEQFTSFDQILSPSQQLNETGAGASSPTAKPVLTLHNARITIFDDAVPGEKGTIRSKPNIDYLVQIEPASSAFSGWMIARKYADFETLHEVLRRISVITGTPFTNKYDILPTWKNQTKDALRGDLERYLVYALSFQPLSESEGMKRFLEKDQGLSKSQTGGKAFGWPDPTAFNNMGKGMMDVLTKAPKGVAGGVAIGGKAFFGGVGSVLGGKKAPGQISSPTRSSNTMPSTAAPAHMTDNYTGGIGFENEGEASPRPRPAGLPRALSRDSTDTQSSLRQRASQSSLRHQPSQDMQSRPSMSSRSSFQGRSSTDGGRRSTTLPRSSMDLPQSPVAPQPPVSQLNTSKVAEEAFDLPPPPSMIDDIEAEKQAALASARQSHDTAPSNTRLSSDLPTESAAPSKSPTKPKAKPPLTEPETQVTIELLFAVITELYTLSSAWNIRRTLLQAAKTFLLRPGNPQLEAIRSLIQESVIDANFSDAGLAAMILKTRENSLPTEEELKKWPKPSSDKEKDELRIKARRLLVERGMPQALTSVMGAAASGEALGKVFDCLQIGSVARSMMFGLMLQGLRALVQ